MAPRRNVRGVDLNRNFPFPTGRPDAWHPLSGTGVRYLPWYRGTGGLSEPETAAVAGLVRRLLPFAAVALHSAGQLFLYPYSWTAAPPQEAAAFRRMGEAFVAQQKTTRYAVKQAHSWYAILGDMDDWLYEELGCLAFTAEIGRIGAAVRAAPQLAGQAFWWANPKDPGPSIENDVGAVLAALLAGHEARTA